MTAPRTRPIALAVVLVAMLAACDRRVERTAPTGQLPTAVPQSQLVPGLPQPREATRNLYSGNASAIAEGERLYNWFNCSGCHAQGGGGMGPPLMDDKWIYGSDPANLFSVIVEGRSNGMPAFGGHIPEQQIWQIIAFIETMGGMKPGDDPSTGGETGITSAAKGPGVKAREGDLEASDPPKKSGGDENKSAEQDPSAIGKGVGPSK
jgi:cytochrome c oxidase cbb3-type subunit III